MPFDDVRRPGPGRGAHERAINLPPALLWLILINVAVHLLRQTLSESVDQQLVTQLGLVPANYTSDPGGPGGRCCWRRSPTSSCTAAGSISAST